VRVLNPQYSPKEGTGAATGSLKDYLCDKLSPDLPIDVRELPMEVPGYQSTLSHFQSCQAHACMVHRPPMGGCTAIEHQLLPATQSHRPESQKDNYEKSVCTSILIA